MKKIRITRKDDPQSRPWQSKDGYYVAIPPERPDGSVCESDYIKLRTLSELRRYIEKGYGTRMVSASGESPSAIIASNLNIEIIEVAGS